MAVDGPVGDVMARAVALEHHLELIEEAKRRDHRKLGRELGLFSIEDEAGPGLVIYHPKGALLRTLLEERDKILREIEECGESTFLDGAEIGSRVKGLVNSYYDLLMKLEHLRPALDQRRTAEIEHSITDLKKQVDAAKMPKNCNGI